MTSQYAEPQSGTDQFNRLSGVFNGTLNTLVSDVVLFPNLSVYGPQYAESRPVSVGPTVSVYTNYLVLQFIAHESTFADVDNEGAGEITFSFDELE